MLKIFLLARELNKPKAAQNWDRHNSFKSNRYWLIHLSYVTLSIAVLSTIIYLLLNIILI